MHLEDKKKKFPGQKIIKYIDLNPRELMSPYLPKLEFSVVGLGNSYYSTKGSVIYSESRKTI